MAAKRRANTPAPHKDTRASIAELVSEVDGIRAKIVKVEKAIREGEDERTRLKRLLVAKGAEVVRALGLGGGKLPSARRLRGGGDGSGAAENAARIVAHMKAEKLKNVGRGALMLALGLSDASASAALKHAVGSGLLTKEGERRGTVYALAR